MKQNVRALAAQILTEVIERKKSLPQVVSDTIPEDYAQRPLLFELCYGTLRWYYLLRALANELLLKPLPKKHQDVYYLLLIGLHQLLNMNIPQYAIVSETVQAAAVMGHPWAKGLMNKNLRRFLEEKDALLAKVDKTEEAKYVHPQWLIGKIKKAWPEQWQDILAANNLRAPLTLRANLLKNTRDEYLAYLKQHEIDAHAVADCEFALSLDKPMPIENIPGFEEGLVSVQDAAGQFAAKLLNLKPNLRVLDACAAPGTKSTHMLELEPKLGHLTAVEKDPERLMMIKQNFERLNLPRDHFNLVLADVAHTEQWWSGEKFDRILVDAPCSGSGVIRRHPDMKVLREPEDSRNHHQVQVHLLNHLWPLLEKKGLLLYSTCSVFPEENEKTIQEFLQKNPEAKIQKFELPFGVAQQYGWQLLPQENGSDGFYYCLITKG